MVEDSAEENEESLAQGAEPEEQTDAHEAPEEIVEEAPVTKLRQVQNVPLDDAAEGSQALTLELKGSIDMHLSFVHGSKKVELICEENYLVCRFGDGTEVRIPTDDTASTSVKRSA